MSRNSLSSLVFVLSGCLCPTGIDPDNTSLTYIVRSTEIGGVDLGEWDIFADCPQQFSLFSPFSIERDIKLPLAESPSIAENIRPVCDCVQVDRRVPLTSRFVRVVSGKEAYWFGKCVGKL